MGKIARVMALLAVFCCLGPIQGGQNTLHAKPVYHNFQEAHPSLRVKPYTKNTLDTKVDTRVGTKIFIGKASWYGPNFHGKLTANGEIFDQNALTAAHRELPFGTKVLVTNLENGKSTLVTINDRGPYIQGRHIDLSRAAAKEVGMIEAGVVDVMMQIVAYE
ncbi:MAG: septal ring lytic transglycosylase RlpA family protein [Tepidanaerobacteraceae bacterium]|nr:septal ring lytic transglycosylase RlpA family protein [Tepidanaerobacter sp.]HQA60443.1 septal ring lytic transglycosylase RlpA family protein [Tepidanaerobacteraceae bacterium]HQE05752.1 septal ring lytic transglycosylase RlpA family protein [Tepidanaerobacteraceae bacterium]